MTFASTQCKKNCGTVSESYFITWYVYSDYRFSISIKGEYICNEFRRPNISKQSASILNIWQGQKFKSKFSVQFVISKSLTSLKYRYFTISTLLGGVEMQTRAQRFADSFAIVVTLNQGQLLYSEYLRQLLEDADRLGHISQIHKIISAPLLLDFGRDFQEHLKRIQQSQMIPLPIHELSPRLRGLLSLVSGEKKNVVAGYDANYLANLERAPQLHRG